MRILSSRNVVAATLCAFAFLVRGAEAAPNEARAAFAPIKIMTYNVQYCKYLPEGATSEVFDPAVTAARILAENPDFCCVNEVRDSAAHRILKPMRSPTRRACTSRSAATRAARTAT